MTALAEPVLVAVREPEPAPTPPLLAYTEFLRRRGSDLLRLATAISGDEAVAVDLVRQAARRTAADLRCELDPIGWAVALRVWTVRAYLSEGFLLGAPVARGVDEPGRVEVVGEASGLDLALARSSRLQRAVLVLRYFEHLREPDIARVVGSTPDGIERYLTGTRAALDVAGPGEDASSRKWTDDDLRRSLHALVADLDVDPVTVVADVACELGVLPRVVLPVAEEVPAQVLPRAEIQAPAAPVDVAGSTMVSDYFDGDWDAFKAAAKKPRPYPSPLVLRTLVVLTTVLGLNYLIWRWIFSVNWSMWWIAVPLVIAETYSLFDSMLFGLSVWRLRQRPEPGPPPDGATVDVFITTYNEPIDLVMATAAAAQRMTYPHTVWILDDGNRPELREVANAEGIDVISRADDWIDMPRHAKAGNLNNALMVTQGEFLVILDADQVPAPNLLERTLGYFRDEKMALVQTPQYFVNVPDADPLGSQAPLFYGPIQAGKDGWNSAFFCGSNAVLRREALLEMGVRRYVLDLESRVAQALASAERVLRRVGATVAAEDEQISVALADVLTAARNARRDLREGAAIGDVTADFQAAVRLAARRIVEADLAGSAADLRDLDDLREIETAGELDEAADELSEAALERLTRRDWSPLAAIEDVRALIAAVDVDRADEAQPIMPLSTISVTEDMATCMRLQGMGWKSAYHDETLAVGLAPEDLGTMLTQRLRWAQGTIQVMLRENPLVQRGLTIPQRLMYFATMWSYLSGFAALAYIAAPIIFLCFGVLPVQSLSTQFFARLIPFLLVNQLLFFVIGRGRKTWRGQQYSLALFPVWIKSVTSAFGNVVLGRSLTFAVTPKIRPNVERLPWHLVRPQLIAMGLLVLAAGIGIARVAVGQAPLGGTAINLFWVCFQLAIFSVIIRAVVYQGCPPPRPSTPESQENLT